MFFAAGWTPCIGTTLGAILTLGFSQDTSGQAMLLSSGYALGLGLPFLAIGLSMERAAHFVRRFQHHDFPRISIDELQERMDRDEVLLLDVRPEVEFQAGHLPGALSIPLDELEQRLEELPPRKLIVAYCRGP